jgi:aspartate dehydrogenase
LFRKLQQEREIDIAFVYDIDRSKLAELDPSVVLESLERAPARKPDLVVEMVNWQWVLKNASFVLRFSDLLIASVAAFADETLQMQLNSVSAGNRTRYYISNGAITGLDGIRAGKEIIQEVKITTIRPEQGYDLTNLAEQTITARTVLYDGPVRKACSLLPRNVNLFATVALYGLGFDRTQCAIVVDPEITIMKHIIEVKGPGIFWKIEVHAIPVDDKKKVYVPESFFQTVKRICSQDCGAILM